MTENNWIAFGDMFEWTLKSSTKTIACFSTPPDMKAIVITDNQAQQILIYIENNIDGG